MAMPSSVSGSQQLCFFAMNIFCLGCMQVSIGRISAFFFFISVSGFR